MTNKWAQVLRANETAVVKAIEKTLSNTMKAGIADATSTTHTTTARKNAILIHENGDIEIVKTPEDYKAREDVKAGTTCVVVVLDDWTRNEIRGLCGGLQFAKQMMAMNVHAEIAKVTFNDALADIEQGR